MNNNFKNGVYMLPVHYEKLNGNERFFQHVDDKNDVIVTWHNNENFLISRRHIDKFLEITILDNDGSNHLEFFTEITEKEYDKIIKEKIDNENKI